MKRRIAFIGYDARLTRQFFLEFCEDNMAQIRRLQRQGLRAELMDGTEVFAVTSDRVFDGLRVDQIILADDSRRDILLARADLLYRLIEAQSRSETPVAYAFQWYDVDDPRPV